MFIVYCVVVVVIVVCVVFDLFGFGGCCVGVWEDVFVCVLMCVDEDLV